MSNTSPSFAMTLPPCVTCPVNLSTIYGLGEIDFEKVAALRRDFLELPGGAVILRPGEAKSVFYTLRYGWAFRYKLTSEGRRAVLGFFLPGDPISLPLLWGSQLHYSVRALTGVGLCVFDRTDMSALVRSCPNMFDGFARLLTREVTSSDERHAECGRLSAKGRVARLILHLYLRMLERRDDDSPTIEFPLRQHHIADAIGITPVHISRIMTDLRGEGVVRIDGQSLTVLDLPALRLLAELPSE